MYPCQLVANLVKGKKSLGYDRFYNLSDAWCSALLLIWPLSNIKPLFHHTGVQLDACKPQPRKTVMLVSCQDPSFVPSLHGLDFTFMIWLLNVSHWEQSHSSPKTRTLKLPLVFRKLRTRGGWWTCKVWKERPGWQLLGCKSAQPSLQTKFKTWRNPR